MKWIVEGRLRRMQRQGWRAKKQRASAAADALVNTRAKAHYFLDLAL